MGKILTKDFFSQETEIVAQELLGKFLVRRIGTKETAVMITETEAYDGPQDMASHASKGRTPRTETMFGNPGIFYVYLVYGMYDMLNIVTREQDYPSAVLIRGVKGCEGPGKLTRHMQINRDINGKPATKASGLWFEDRGALAVNIQKLPRIGVAYAGPVWSAKKLRFTIY